MSILLHRMMCVFPPINAGTFGSCPPPILTTLYSFVHSHPIRGRYYLTWPEQPSSIVRASVDVVKCAFSVAKIPPRTTFKSLVLLSTIKDPKRDFSQGLSRGRSMVQLAGFTGWFTGLCRWSLDWEDPRFQPQLIAPYCPCWRNCNATTKTLY